MAESSRDEIAKLESMYAANPEGRVFTHLAEAYRKAGDLVRAREVLEDGLQRHTDSASGYVVLGRVMQDMGQAQEATAAFARVLELDPENRVALRALGELARAAGDTEQATAHFRQLLALDPSDDSVEALLAELKNGPAPAPAAEPAAEAPSFETAFEAPQATSSFSVEATPPASGSLDGGVFDFGSLAEPAQSDGTPASLDIASLSAAAPADASHDATPAELSPALELPAVDAGWSGGVEGDVAAWPGMAESTPPVEGLETGSAHAGEDAAPLPMLEGTDATWLATVTDSAAADAGAPPPALEAPPEWEGAEPTEVVTETMAELYRAQGHLDRAVEVYRALLRDRPGDEQLERKLLELELAILSPETASPAPAEPAQEPPPSELPQTVAEGAGAQPAAAEGEPVPTEASAAAPAFEAAPAEASEQPQAEAPALQSPAAAEPEPWSAPVEEEPWSAPAAAAAQEVVADATPHAELPEPWAEAAAQPEAPAELSAFAPEPVVLGEDTPAEAAAPSPAEAEAAAPSPEPAVLATMEAVWTSGGDVPEDEPSPYDWQAPEEEVGPPVSDYLRGLLAWRRTTPAPAAYEPAPPAPAPGAYETPTGFEAAVYEPPAREAPFQPPTGYETSPYEAQGFAAPSAIDRPAGFEAGELEPWEQPVPEYPAESAAAESGPEALPPEWLDATPAAPTPVEEEPWSPPPPPPPAPTWAEEAADEVVAREELVARPPSAGDELDWLTGPDGVAPETPPPAPQSVADESGRGEGPTDDDDLEMFRAWLQSLKK